MKFHSKFQAFMVISVLMSLVFAIAFHALCVLNGGPLFSALRITALTFLYHFAVRLFIGEWLVPSFNLSRLNPEGWWFRLHRWEHWLYRCLGVQRWKRRLPTYNPSEFDLLELGPEAILRSTCRAEIVHELNVLASFAPLAVSRYVGAFPVFLLTSIAAACCDLAFVIVQRYNRPRLARLMRKWEKRMRDAGLRRSAKE